MTACPIKGHEHVLVPVGEILGSMVKECPDTGSRWTFPLSQED